MSLPKKLNYQPSTNTQAYHSAGKIAKLRHAGAGLSLQSLVDHASQVVGAVAQEGVQRPGKGIDRLALGSLKGVL